MGLKRTCKKYKVVMARSAAGRRRALRCADLEKAKKVGKNPCGDARLKTRRGQSVPGRSPGLIRVRKTSCRRG